MAPVPDVQIQRSMKETGRLIRESERLINETMKLVGQSLAACRVSRALLRGQQRLLVASCYASETLSSHVLPASKTGNERAKR